jgi:MFS family permease
MLSVAKSPPKQTAPAAEKTNLLLFFAVAYIGQGLATQWGLIAQPLQYFMMKSLNMNAAQISSCLALMMLPWVAKPFYGFLCDFFPLFGYRRKSYLIGASLIAAACFAVMAGTVSLPVILIALLISSLGMSLSTAVMVGLAVEDGRSNGKARDYFSSQSFWYYVANVGAAIVGGLLCQHFLPANALHTAALCAIIPLLITAILTPLMLKEERSELTGESLNDTWKLLRQALNNRRFWLVGGLYFAFNFFPAFGVPLYVFESKTLLFSQTQIGQLSATYAGGMILGATVYSKFFKTKQLTTQLLSSLVLMTVSTLSYLALSHFAIAIPIEILRGTCTTIMLLSLYAIATEVCPRRAEVSIMALLVAIRNLATESCTFVGGLLFTHVFANHYYPLVAVAAACSSITAALIWLWHKHHNTNR